MRFLAWCLLVLAAGAGCALERGTDAEASTATLPNPQPLDSLLAQVAHIVAPAGGRIGVGLALLGTDQSVTLAGSERFPTQSVFKLPLAMTVLDAVDRGALRLDQPVRVEPSDFVSRPQHSPIRNRHPRGVTLTLAEVLRAAASNSDGTAADVLLGLVGGPGTVTDYIRGVGVSGFEVAVTEKDMGRDPKAQYRNWATPFGAVALLRALDAGEGLTPESRAHLFMLLTDTPTGPNRLRGRLPEGTVVAHKTGTSRTVDGLTAATNDIGIVTLPGGRRVAVAVFVSESTADEATREGVIAGVAQAAYDFWTPLPQNDVAPSVRRSIAITVDDLPGNLPPNQNCDAATYRDLTRRLTEGLTRGGVTATGFVNESKVCDERRDELLPELLSTWLEAGNDLGNHTYSHRAFHADLSGRPDPTLAEYEAELLQGERVTRAVMAERGRAPRYFRHPYLRTGPDDERKAAFASLLAEHGYEVAPVTIDNSEWVYAGAYNRAQVRGDTAAARKIAAAYLTHMAEMTAFYEELSVEVVGREIPQVLLIHANALNADHIGSLLDLYRGRGYRFVTLDSALGDEAYRQGDVYTGPRGHSWLQRWRYAEVGAIREEPEVPEWVQEAIEK